MDQDIAICSNNAAFVITIAAVRHALMPCPLVGGVVSFLYRRCSFSILLPKANKPPSLTESQGGLSSTKILVCPSMRSSAMLLADSSLANAVAHQDHLEFLEDVVPKTQPYKMVKHEAAATRAQINGGKASDDRLLPDGKKQKLLVNGEGFMSLGRGSDERSDDANAQLEEEARQAERVDDSVDDVEMTS